MIPSSSSLIVSRDRDWVRSPHRVRHRLLLLAAVLVLIQKLLHRNANLSDGLIAEYGTISHDLDD
ncbi:hypothetical protein Bca4012_045691 [Brassica carinata]|uniref:Uncharacterized protein n=1 Tax=Brassica carinata TaxID=52824 RepID=A0A8X7UC70_BRACI|nr:hypothetical protein Bca52824_056860 [Brassica carinata]